MLGHIARPHGLKRRDNLAAAMSDQPKNRAEQRCLARAVWTDEWQKRSTWDIK